MTDANGGVVTYTTDGRGNRLTRTSTPDDHAVTETWEYDAADVLQVETQPVDLEAETPVYRETSYTYTPAGEIDTIEDGSGRTTDYDYQADGTIDTITYTDTGTSATRVVDFGYDDAARRTSASVDTGGGADETVYGFGDESGQVTSVDGPGADDDYTIGYDTAGRPTSLVPPDGVEVDYGYDTAGRLATVDRRPGTAGEVTTYSYDPDGNLTGQDLPDVGAENQYRHWDYDPATGLLDHYDERVDGTRHTTDTAFDPFGRLWIDWTDGTVTTYTYDAADQLTGVHRSDSVFDTSITGDDVAYAYDAAGNRTARLQGPPGIGGGTSPTVLDDGDGTLDTYTYDDANQLVAVASTAKDDWSYTYDTAGRMTAAYVDNNADRDPDTGQEQHGYAYDPAGLLAEATTSIDGTEWVDTRSYDPDGGLTAVDVVQTSPDGPDEGSDPDVVDHTFDYVWDTALAVPQPVQLTSDQPGFEVIATFTNGLGLVGGGTDRIAAHLALPGPSSLDLYPATDIHGSTIPTANTTGFARANSYDEYGNPTGPVLNNPHEPTFGYRGELQTTNTIHLRHRDYQPTTGTFTTTDPMAGVDGTPTVANPYHYADSNPINEVDPLGLRPMDDDLSYGGAKAEFTYANFTPQPGRGRVRIALYIPTETAGLSIFGVNTPMSSHGDHRGPDPYAHDSRSRAVATVDYEAGRAEFRINPSCGTGGPPDDCHSALPIIDDFGSGSYWFQGLPFVDDSNRVTMSARGNGEIYIRYAILNSDKRLVANFARINGTFELKPVGRTAVCLDYSRDSYPAMEAYQYIGRQSPIDILRQGDAWGPTAGLANLPFTDKRGTTCGSGGGGGSSW